MLVCGWNVPRSGGVIASQKLNPLGGSDLEEAQITSSVGFEIVK